MLLAIRGMLAAIRGMVAAIRGMLAAVKDMRGVIGLQQLLRLQSFQKLAIVH
jgi:hypothetical protein